jgi:hypothetical protein
MSNKTKTVWYITKTIPGDYRISNPEITDIVPGDNFETYTCPSNWNIIDILIDNNGDIYNYTFMSQNPNQIEKLVNLWNTLD